EGHGQPLKIDIAAQHFINVSAFLPGQQRCAVNLWYHGMRGESVGKQLAAFHPLPNVLQNLPQMTVLLPFDQKIEGVQNWQPGLDQRQKLLVEHEERTLLDLASAAH